MNVIRCRHCNEQLMEATRIAFGEMEDTPTIPVGVMRNEEGGQYYKDCPHCGARNGFHEASGFNGARVLQQGDLLSPPPQ